ncbi:MAG: GntR family transcriptional regulator [Terriglobales bacterium]
MNFFIDTRSKYPVHEQIKERLRMALAFGELRPGDTLPSIRELAVGLNVGTALVRRAYMELGSAGLLSVTRSRRVVVNRELNFKRDHEGSKAAIRKLAGSVLRDLLKLGVHPQSFVSYLQHCIRRSGASESLIIFAECNRIQADQFAADVSQAWGVPVRGMDFDALRKISHKELRGARHLCTIPFHYEEACEVARKHKMRVVSVSVHWDSKVIERIASLKPGSRIAFVFKRRDLEEYGQLFVKQIEGLFPNAGLIFGTAILGEIEPVEKWLERGESQLVFFSNRIWDNLTAAVRGRPDVATPTLRPDPLSLERARLEVGILS